MNTKEHLLTAQEVSDYLGVPVGTCYAWRYKRVGPRSIKVGRHLRYRQSDVEAWLATQVEVGR